MNCEMTLPETGEKGFSPWFDIHFSAKKDRKSINQYINKKNKKKPGAQSIDDEVNLSIARAILRDMDEKVKITYELAMYEFGAISEEDINACLTGRQAQVVLLRQKMNFKEIAQLLEISCKTVYETYKEGLLKLIRFRERAEAGLPTSLSKQQLEIYKLKQSGCKPKEISKRLSISPRTVYKQLNRIKQKNMTKK